MKTTAKFTYDKVRFDQENEIHLVVSLDAPALDWEKKRTPIAIIPVVDISGSMAGEKLEYAKQSLLKLVDHLRPGDYCGLVAFESFVHEIHPLVELTQSTKDSLKAKIGDLKDRGGTNFSDGLMKGLDWANKADIPEGMLLRVIMFTDGQPTGGVTTPDGIKKLLEVNRGRATVSAFGYGQGCNHDLLSDMSKNGEGNYAFIAKPEDALTAFGKELGGLLSTYAQNIVIDVAPHNGHKIVDVVSDVDVEDEDGKIKVKMADILSEEKRSVVIKMTLSKQKQALPRAMSAADIKIEYDVLDNGKKQHREESFKAKVQFVKPGDEQSKPTPDIDAVVGLAELSQKQIEAEQFVAAGNFTAAAGVLQAFAVNANARGLEGLGLTSVKLSDNYSDSVQYGSSASYRSSTKGMTSRAYSVSKADDSATADLQSIFAAAGTSMSNHAHASMADAFSSAPVEVGNVLASVAGEISAAGGPASAPGTPKAEAKSTKSSSKKRSKRW